MKNAVRTFTANPIVLKKEPVIRDFVVPVKSSIPKLPDTDAVINKY
jgi:hypothetical protein